MDTIFWQYPGALKDRVKTKEFVQVVMSQKAHHFRLNADWPVSGLLDKMCGLSAQDSPMKNISQIQANWHLITDEVFPFLVEKPLKSWCAKNSQGSLMKRPLRSGQGTVRDEAARARDLLETEIDKDWSLNDLSNAVHISSRQLARVFKNAYGKTPSEYQTVMRVKSMAQLLRDTDLNIEAVANQVGWRSRARATTAFKSYLGMSPGSYRSRAKDASFAPL